MNEWFNRLFRLDEYREVAERVRAQFIVGVTLTLLLLYTLHNLFIADLPAADGAAGVFITRAQQAAGDASALLVLVAPMLLALLALLLVRMRRLALAGPAMVAALFGGVVMTTLLLPMASFGHIGNALLLAGVIQVTFLVINIPAGIAMAVIASLAMFIRPGAAAVTDIMTATLVLVGIGVTSGMFVRLAQIARIDGIRAAITERARLTELISSLAELTTTPGALPQLMERAVQHFRELYPEVETAGVYLVDGSGVYADCVAQAGSAALAPRVAIGSASEVGQALLEVAAQRSAQGERLAVPIEVNQRAVGALALHAAFSGTFHPRDAALYRSIAYGFGLVVNGAQQVQRIEQRAQENARLAEQARSALAEVQRLNKRLIGRAWSEYLKDDALLSGQEYDAHTRTVQPLAAPSALMQQALRHGATHASDQWAAFPLRARGQVVGVVEIELPAGAAFTAEQLALLDELGDRFGLAMENVRLLEQSQRGAQRESLINVISTRIQSSTNVESMLAEAARSLNELLLTNRVAIRLGKPDTMQPSRAIEEVP